jgi:AraC family transcriptional regulator
MSSFHGVEVQALTSSGIRYGTRDFPAHFATAPHTHEEAYFCLVVDGASAQRSGRGEHLRDRGRAYFYPAGEVQSERFGPKGSRLFSVQLGGSVLAELRETVRLPQRSSELDGLAALTVRRLELESRRGDALGLEELTMLLVGALARESRSAVRWAPIVRDYLHARFKDKPTLAQIAAAAGLHPVHLCRAFPQRFGVTLGDYLRGLRVDYAARQLVATDRVIVDIALDAGFSSQAHLTREMRKLLGTTPAAYREC